MQEVTEPREIETMKSCRYKWCRYKGRIGGVDSCDYCFITGHVRGCKISECTHALEEGKSRREVAHERQQYGIF